MASTRLPASWQGLNEAIQQTNEQITIRVYGGFVYATDGEIGAFTIYSSESLFALRIG